MIQARVAVVLGTLGLTLGASGADAQSLEQALISAYLTNPQLEAQRAALRATDELVPQALGGWRPTVEAEGAVVYNDTDGSGNTGDTFTTRSGSVALDQNIYNGGETVANTRRAERLVRVERARLVVVEQDVLLDAVTVYTDLLAARAVLDFANQNEGRLLRQLQATRDRFEVGEVTRTDVAQAEARHSGAIADRIQAEGAVAAAIASYRRVINQEPAGLVVPPPLDLLPPSEDEAQQLGLDLNPSIAAAQYNLSAAESDVDVAESALLPSVSVRGELAYARDPSENLNYRRDASIGASLRVPLYQGGGEYARIRQTKQTVRQRRDEVEDTIRAVRDEVTASWEALVTATSRIESIGAQVRANEIAVEGSRQEALVGQRTTLDVLDQESDLFQSQVDLVQARRDQIVASYRLKAAVGQLTAGGISLPVQPYDSEAYYNDTRNRWIGVGESPGG
ncbi:MAG: TolC family outer membrane protein [Pseudomonadota bacterium]